MEVYSATNRAVHAGDGCLKAAEVLAVSQSADRTRGGEGGGA